MGFIQDQVSPFCGQQLAILESWSKKGFLELSLSSWLGEAIKTGYANPTSVTSPGQ